MGGLPQAIGAPAVFWVFLVSVSRWLAYAVVRVEQVASGNYIKLAAATWISTQCAKVSEPPDIDLFPKASILRARKRGGEFWRIEYGTAARDKVNQINRLPCPAGW